MTRIAVVEREKCNPIKCGNYLCIRLCPVNRAGKECIVIGDDKKAAVNEDLCNGCGICQNRCPFESIHIINLPKELDQKPIHRYGKNGFQLYSLPVPMFGKVVGLVGKNGIGKSTAIKILAGVLNPNMGDARRKNANYDELIDFFKGTEAQNFFEKVRDGKIRASYKPQNVDMIPKQYKGKVIDLLKKVDEKNAVENVAAQLELGKILDSDIKEISGGELQRVAIAAAVLKKANLYIFDEPTSYLDIKQRIKISKFISSLADAETAVLVVEHDLIIVDYMTDLTHLMYGKPACYGIVSQPKTTKAGINIYLHGFLKEENVRFRDYEIKFYASPPVSSKKGVVMTSWENITKVLGKFHLAAPEGTVYLNRVIGILGENGIGKTSFVRILAGEIEPDDGYITKKVKVSYKPQYLVTSDKIVAEVLRDAVMKYEVQLLRPLQLKNLMDKKVDELSGGELQRVAIALCLSQDADLYLLDEPSAYLDVEQRLVVSKVIKDMASLHNRSALVVDHDLLFIDYLSESLIVFEGIPAEKGVVEGPFSMELGMNKFLTGLGLTFRRDEQNHRPRANKPGSQMDRKQKSEGKLYYN